MQFTDYVVRVAVVDRHEYVTAVEKKFKTAEARAKWLEKNDHKIYQVLGYSDPQ